MPGRQLRLEAVLIEVIAQCCTVLNRLHMLHKLDSVDSEVIERKHRITLATSTRRQYLLDLNGGSK